MKALSVMQPWASLIVGWLDRFDRWHDGPKSIENRTWEPSTKLIGERFAIHASKKVDPAGFAAWTVHGDSSIDIYKLPRAAIVGVATLAMVVIDEYELRKWRETLAEPSRDDDEHWYAGDVGLVLRDRRGLREPRTCTGSLGFWTVPADVEASVRAQLSEAA